MSLHAMGYTTKRYFSSRPPQIAICGNTPLCPRCVSVFQTETALNQLQAAWQGRPFYPDMIEGYDLHIAFGDFWEAGERGCFICSTLRSCHPSSYWDDKLKRRATLASSVVLDLRGFFTKINYVGISPEGIELVFVIGMSFSTVARGIFRLVQGAEEQTIPGVLTEPSEYSGSESSLTLAKHWYYNCLSSHDSCGQFTTPFRGNTWMPTRLIHITNSTVRLCESRSLPEANLPYATLSHCWGKSPIFTMNTTNITELKKALPMDQLPQTFRDAILVCRDLQILYLWIDSLCIVQDSMEDWASESKVMGLVYKHCCLNIAATGFSDGLKGIFVNRNHQFLKPLNVQSAGNKLVKKGTYHLIWDSLWYEQILSAPLNTRAWVFQERLLSPRILHFGTREILWECKEKEACESYPQSIPDNGEAPTNQISHQRNFKRNNPIDGAIDETMQPGEGSLSKYRLWEFWCAIVEAYSGSQLTHEKDKLVAFSGVVEEMKKFINSDCLAGIWRQDLIFQLMWHVPKDEWCNVSRPRYPQAPSWSWASINARVTLRHKSPDAAQFGRRDMSRLLSASVSGDGTNCLSQGELRFMGPLVEAVIEPDDQNWKRKLGSKLSEAVNLLNAPPRLRIHLESSSGQSFVRARLILIPDDVREWDQIWISYLMEYINIPALMYDSSVPKWPKLMKKGSNKPDSIFLLPLYATGRKKDDKGEGGEHGRGEADDELENRENHGNEENEKEEHDSTYWAERREGDTSSDAHLKDDQDQGEEEEKFFGLILTPTGASDGVFRRIGVFESRTAWEDETTFEDILEERLHIQKQNFQIREGRNHCIVSII